MNQKICPYPGLRPFSVEESVFFKGRDMHIRQIINKLEEKKILILTGASGDGKSSLVYAGVIPNARAGFFRAKYNNWLFATFRPERDPLGNLADCIAENLQIDKEYCQNELKYGFSALADLYKTSPFYIDENDDEFIKLSVKDKNQRKLQSANLFILADQFEEFFTNSENFTNGKPSTKSYTAVNLLLETAKIALRDNLPIYIICTMRSDFISQSVAFRGLPETIGFSQFFVPRLNRNELQQVIEEPAILSGGKVSKRLKELLINELHDGFDQLPLLQHTLKQLWGTAGNGEEEIDLIHLAKLGGIETKFLTPEDKIIFEEWIKSEGSYKKKYIENPSSGNVLNAHANYLYDNAYDYFLKNTDWAEKNISRDEAKYIIKTAFQSLVKIDEGRAVRSRITLRDITNIVNRKHIKYETICGILNIFRLHDSTFLYPFIEEDIIETQYISSFAVLDITHEALIRNWEYLKKWNEEEFENLNNFNDFNIQLQRWVHNNKSNDYLLTLGALTHFEAWYEKCNPNKYWFAKYDPSMRSYEEKLSDAEFLVEDTKEFLSKSRDFITRIEKSKRRRKNILLSASLLVILTLSGFTYWAFTEKAAAQLQKIVAEQQTDSAKFQQRKAVEANAKADSLRLISQENEKNALLAKAQSDSARSLAERMRLFADEKTILANTEAQNAKREKQNADKQRKEAEIQKKRALAASDSATTLSYLAISQSLGYRSMQKFEDNQLNALLALQAYNFSEKYGGYERDAVLFDALKHSLLVSGQKNNSFVTENTISSFYDLGNNIIIFCNNGDLIKYDKTKKSVINQNKIFKSEIPVNNSYFLNSNLVIVNTEDKKLFLITGDSNKQIELKGHTDFIRAVAISKSSNFFVTGSRDKTVQFRNIETGEVLKTLSTADRVNVMELSPDSKSLYAGLNNGDLIKIALSDYSSETISTGSFPIFSLCIFPNGKRFAAGYSDGGIIIFNISNNAKYTNFKVSNSGVRSIAVNSESNLLATSTDDKIIKIYDLDDLVKKPCMINDFNQKIKLLSFSGTKLSALAIDNSLYFWETNPENYAKEIKQILKRNLTKEEWERFVGDKIPYETLY